MSVGQAIPAPVGRLTLIGYARENLLYEEIRMNDVVHERSIYPIEIMIRDYKSTLIHHLNYHNGRRDVLNVTIHAQGNPTFKGSGYGIEIRKFAGGQHGIKTDSHDLRHNLNLTIIKPDDSSIQVRGGFQMLEKNDVIAFNIDADTRFFGFPRRLEYKYT